MTRIWRIWFRTEAKSVEVTRTLLARRKSCDEDEDDQVGSCPGWSVFDTSGSMFGDRKEIQRCDVCAPGGLSDSDVAVLPEALEALSNDLATGGGCGCAACVMAHMARRFAASTDEGRFYLECLRCKQKTFFDDWYKAHTGQWHMTEQSADPSFDPNLEDGSEPIACMHCRAPFLTIDVVADAADAEERKA